jgi:hypothetical protein
MAVENSAVRQMHTLTSFSGADLLVSFGKRVVGELQQISWATHREKAPVYTLGSADPRSVSRGKRGIGGGLIVAQFDRDALLEELKMQWKDSAPQAMFTASPNLAALYKGSGWNQMDGNKMGVGVGEVSFERLLAMTEWDDYASRGLSPSGEDESVAAPDTSTNDDSVNLNVPEGFATMHIENVTYLDQLPPVDITLTFANEYGNAAFQKIYDAEFLSESSGVSVDTIVMEREIAWLARKMSPILQGVFQANNQYGMKIVQ